jgi:hypothetical protein
MKIIYEQDYRNLRSQLGKKRSRRIEKPQLVLLWIAKTKAFKVSDRVLVRRASMLYEIVIERLDEWLIRQLSFLLMDGSE